MANETNQSDSYDGAALWVLEGLAGPKRQVTVLSAAAIPRDALDAAAQIALDNEDIWFVTVHNKAGDSALIFHGSHPPSNLLAEDAADGKNGALMWYPRKEDTDG